MTYMELAKVGSNFYLKRRWRDGHKLRSEVVARYGRVRPRFYAPELLFGDAREVVPKMPQGSVHLVVTSPPYFPLKDGVWTGYDDYLAELNDVWRACYIALDNGCRLCINIGDTWTKTEDYGRHMAYPIHADVIAGAKGVRFDYMGTTIWRKASTIRPSGGCHIMGSWASGYPRESIQPFSNHEFILIFKKQGRPKRTPTEREKLASKIPPRERNAWYDPLWAFPGERKTVHSAPFPLELPERLIRMFSFVGDTVLDPFMGSGTTLLAALRWARRGIGIDIAPECVEVTRKRLEPYRHRWESNGGEVPAQGQQ